MKYCFAVILVVVTLASAEPPVNRGFLARQQAEQPPYPAKGRPFGPAFNLPLRSQKQQTVPATSYGAPQQEYGPPPPQEYGPPSEESTTTEIPTTTETVETTTFQQAERLQTAPVSQKLTNVQQKETNPASLYVVVPQTQNLIYATAPLTSAKLVAEVKQPRLLPVQAVPAFAKLQEVPQAAAPVPQYQFVTAVSSAYTSFVNTPFSYSFVQSFQ